MGPLRADATAGVRLRAGVVSLAAGTAILGVKFLAYLATGSTAVLSDALESIVNVVAAAFALGSLVFASRPADPSHPYGHGKVEFLSGGFEGGLIAFAALLIVQQALEALWAGHELHRLDQGAVLVATAGGANAVLGFYLVRLGRRVRSPALEADGLHVLTDFWTSAGVVLALVLVRVTGWQFLDPLVALALGGQLAVVGARLVRRSVGGLLDESDPDLLADLARAINAARPTGVIAVHRLRAIRSGGVVNIDAHIVVPRFWSVAEGHEAARQFEEAVIHRVEHDAGFVFHVDPCRAVYCRRCQVSPCPVRARPFEAAPDLALEELTGEPPPDESAAHSTSRVDCTI
jgi:cation diffusion facilitator family transporter